MEEFILQGCRKLLIWLSTFYQKWIICKWKDTLILEYQWVEVGWSEVGWLKVGWVEAKIIIIT